MHYLLFLFNYCHRVAKIHISTNKCTTKTPKINVNEQIVKVKWVEQSTNKCMYIVQQNKFEELA